MLKILQFILLFPALCLFYLLVWPVEIDPVAWDAPIPPAMEGNFANSPPYSEKQQIKISIC